MRFNWKCALSAGLVSIAFLFIENPILYLVMLVLLGVFGVYFCQGYVDVESLIPGLAAVLFSQGLSYYIFGLTATALIVQYLLTLVSLWLLFGVVAEFL